MSTICIQKYSVSYPPNQVVLTTGQFLWQPIWLAQFASSCLCFKTHGEPYTHILECFDCGKFPRCMCLQWHTHRYVGAFMHRPSISKFTLRTWKVSMKPKFQLGFILQLQKWRAIWKYDKSILHAKITIYSPSASSKTNWHHTVHHVKTGVGLIKGISALYITIAWVH